MGIDGVEVQLKSYKLEDEQIVFVESCDRKPNEEPTVEDAYWGRYAGVVREFTSYEVQGRVFAYRFTYYVVQAKNGYITTRAGAAVDFYYLDENGNGTFEQYLGAMPLRFLPDWVIARAQEH
jgi:hypothetical protein